MIRFILLFQLGLLAFAGPSWAQAQRVVDIPTRPGVTQRMIVITPEKPMAAVVLFAGGHGGLQISPEGIMKWGDGNFLVRTRQMFASKGLTVAVVNAPSNRPEPSLPGRLSPEAGTSGRHQGRHRRVGAAGRHVRLARRRQPGSTNPLHSLRRSSHRPTAVRTVPS